MDREGALLSIRGREAFDQPAVDGLKTVQRRLGLGNLDLSRGESVAFRALLQPPCEEGLPAAVLPANCLELRTPGRDRPQLLTHHGVERLESDRERVQTAPGNGSAPQGVDDLVAALGADHWPDSRKLFLVTGETELRCEQIAIELDGFGGLVDGQHGVPVDVQDPSQDGHDAAEPK